MANEKQNPGNPSNTGNRDKRNEGSATQAGQNPMERDAAGNERERDMETGSGRQDQGGKREEGNRGVPPSGFGRDGENKSPEREEVRKSDAGNTSGGKHDA